MHDEVVTILTNEKINAEYWKLVFESARLSKKVLPGQFMNIQIEDQTDPFLRRPFSYYRVNGKKVEILYEILGRGTGMLARKKKGETLQVLGPLGKPFVQEIGKRKRVLVAGGIGVPPLVYLAENLPVGARRAVPLLLIGCHAKSEALPKSELRKIKAKIMYATEDGSYGVKGFVTAALEKVVRENDPRLLFIQTCGPHPMMAAVMKLARQYGIEGEASMDETMACGVGACLGCMVKTKDGYKTSCVDGPVFGFTELTS